MTNEDLVKDNKEIKDSDKNLVVAFNTLKRIDTRDLYSIVTGFKINYCPMCGRKL